MGLAMDLFPFTFFGASGTDRGFTDQVKSLTSTFMPWLNQSGDWPIRWPLTQNGHDQDFEDMEGTSPLDRMIHASIGRMTGSLSPASVGLAFTDWAIHFAFSPGRRAQINEKLMRKALKLSLHAWKAAGDPNASPCIEPRPGDRRFSAPEWCQWPFSIYYQTFLLAEQAAELCTRDIRGVSAHHERIVSFLARQWLDMISPTNFPATNPEVIDRTIKEGGANLMRGASNYFEDTLRRVVHESAPGAENLRPGQALAVTPGKVVYRNELIELIQYSPQTQETMGEPLLIVPAWIMKYYILDLSPENSFVRYMVSQGFTVFCISWHNPTARDRDLTLNDYRTMGVTSALNAIRSIMPGHKVHMAGYCLGGTLSAITASHMAREGDETLSTLTLLAAETDFREAGELRLFIDESQIAFLEDIMWDKGYLRTDQMSGAFQLLRSADLVWSRSLKSYLLGERDSLNDLMAWNADGTRLPYRMHSEYLRHLFLRNELAEGRYMIDGAPLALSDLRMPLFVVGTETDHVAPWKSVYRLHLYADTDITFTLTSGGHNAGIVSEPGHPHRHYRIATKTDHEPYIDGDAWVARTPVKEGSWWPAYAEWLKARSSAPGAPPAMGSAQFPAICDAPGTYVLER